MNQNIVVGVPVSFKYESKGEMKDRNGIVESVKPGIVTVKEEKEGKTQYRSFTLEKMLNLKVG